MQSPRVQSVLTADVSAGCMREKNLSRGAVGPLYIEESQAYERRRPPGAADDLESCRTKEASVAWNDSTGA